MGDFFKIEVQSIDSDNHDRLSFVLTDLVAEFADLAEDGWLQAL